MADQDSLFSTAQWQEIPAAKSHPSLRLSARALQEWKQQVFEYQQQVQATPTPQQGSLLALSPTVEELADRINPFTLPPQNTEFWRWQTEDAGGAAFYFVIDDELPLLLYVGETLKSNQRWKGEHDCKRYLLNYVSAHHAHGLPVAVNIGFLHGAPEQTRERQTLEAALIAKWRSPFNQENWAMWGTPFTGGK